MTHDQALSAPLQNWLNKGHLLKLQGHEIFYVDEGDPSLPTLILVHGFPTSSYDFSYMWEQLRSRYRLICLDMLGFGFSDKPDQRNYKIHQQADLFEGLIEYLQIGDYHMLTHDYGVSVSQEMLARKADGTAKGNCLSCCFLNGGLFPETHRALLIQKILLSPFGKLANKLNGFAKFSKSFSRVFGENTKPSQEELEIFWQVINYKQGRHLFHNLITYIDDRREHRERWLQALQNCEIPLAVINGSVDPVSGAHLVQRYQELNCRLDYLAELSELGHYPHTEDPATVADHYLNFMTQQFG